MSHLLRNPLPHRPAMTDDRSFTHLDAHGRPRMVDVGDKPVTRRIAVAEGKIRMSSETLAAIVAGETPKGNVLLIAQLAGIMGAKRTPDLIPLCHSIPLSAVEVDVKPDDSLPGIVVRATVTVDARTGVEMEALSAVTISLLTVYDMCKARDRGMAIENVRLLRKEGGRSGAWNAPPEG
jgi:cyclic pyranopterin phosphate synthase